jgi:hypothetical protein
VRVGPLPRNSHDSIAVVIVIVIVKSQLTVFRGATQQLVDAKEGD